MADTNTGIALGEDAGPESEFISRDDKAAAEGDDPKSAPPAADKISDDISELKKKILELEARQGNPGFGGPEQGAIDSKLMAEMEQYKRMQACLYKHRKEWETNVGPGNWVTQFDAGRSLASGTHHWMTFPISVHGERTYNRPDVFDPTHVCGPDVGHIDESGKYDRDDFDMTIDWGNRRDRLRKNFEWEMDRLFLNEELQKKRETQIKGTEEKKRRERRMAKMEAQLNNEQNPEEIAPTLADSTVHKPNWVEWYQFKRLSHKKETEASILDVLIGEPVIDDDGGNRFWFSYSGSRIKKGVAKSTGQKPFDAMNPDKSSLPERIRIHSDALLRIFSEILGSEGRSLAELEETTAVFIRPYKALAYREQALRDWCTALEKKFKGTSAGQLTTPSANLLAETNNEVPEVNKQQNDDASNNTKPDALTDPSKGLINEEQADKIRKDTGLPEDRADESDSEDEQEKEPENINDLTKSLTALKHLKCLLEFVDSSVVAKRQYLNGTQCRKVFFSDLWQLFRPGVEVIDNDGKQAYKVVGVTSAKHLVASPWERWWSSPSDQQNAGRKKSDFSITCVYIDFDGKNIGPVIKYFDIKRFDGEREVTSFEVYPLRFHPVRRSEYNDAEWQDLENYPAQERYRRKLILRGAKFLEVAGVKHMYYAGPTLEVKDDVESPVVIDFETAFTVRDDQLNSRDPMVPPDMIEREAAERDRVQRLWKPNLITLIGHAWPEDLEPNDYVENACGGDCCRNEFVYDDQYVDRQQRTEYVNSLLPKTSILDELPPITIMPRPLKELRTGPEKRLVCPEDELVIMSYRVFGFILRSRKWAKLDLSHLTEIHPPETSTVTTTTPGKVFSQQDKKKHEPALALNRLVLEKGHHSMIVSLIAQHFRDKKSITGSREEFDLVKGKGKGLIILLHGAPGVGKTSTAEGVAEMFQKPLFQITCGDLGTTAAEVERALEMNFSLANKWDCILLLDEADVFLAERTKEDFKRNGLVAVFLRLMEYYSGILFLTTNRVGDFDEAFTSRIHVSLYYPELNEDKTVQVFKINMDMIEDRFRTKKRIVEIDRMEIASFATKYYAEHPQARWNGRQIRNACQTALALAEFEAQDKSLSDIENLDTVVNLRVEHFEIVRNAYLEFTKYMHDLYGSTAARRAKEARLRAIWFDENDRVVKTQNMGGAGMDKKNAFLLASQAQPSRPMGHSPQRSFEQPYLPKQGDFSQSSYQQPQQNYYQNSMQNQAFGGQQPPFNNPPPGHMQGQMFSSNHNWNSQSTANASVFSPEPQDRGQLQSPIPPRQQGTPTPQSQQQQQQQQQQSQQISPNPTWLNESIRDMYSASGKQSDGQMTGGTSAPVASGWNCPACARYHFGQHSGFCPACGWKSQ